MKQRSIGLKTDDNRRTILVEVFLFSLFVSLSRLVISQICHLDNHGLSTPLIARVEQELIFNNT